MWSLASLVTSLETSLETAGAVAGLSHPATLALVALLPLTTGLLLLQRNPYHALVIRGMLGAIAALVYALFGAADVALTEALVGTLLAITLYAVTVRSALTIRLGLLSPLDRKGALEPENGPEEQPEEQPEAPALAPTLTTAPPSAVPPPERIIEHLRGQLQRHHLRLELVPFLHAGDLQAALSAKEIHTALIPQPDASAAPLGYQLQTRIPRLCEILQTVPITLHSPASNAPQSGPESGPATPLPLQSYQEKPQ